MIKILTDKFRHTFRSLRGNKPLQLYLLSQVARLCAWAALNVSISWMVYSATKSSLALAWINFFNFLPMLLLGMSGGYIADRFDRKNILLVTQTLNTILMLAFMLLAMQSERPLLWIGVLYTIVGVVFAHDQPVRQALIMNLVSAEERVNAFCCEMIISTGTMMFAFATAGKIVEHFGEPASFGGGAVCLVIASVLLFFVKHNPVDDDGPTTEDTKKEVTKKDQKRILDGLRYVVTTRDARRVFIHNSIALMFGTKYGLLFPAITIELLHGSSGTLGYLDAAHAVGGAVAGFVLANIALSPKWGGPYVALAGSILLYGLAYSNSFVLSALVAALLGLAFTLQNNGNYAVLQTVVPDRLRGRTIAIYLVVTQTIDQIGNLGAGAIERKVGVQHTLIIEATLCTLAFAAIALERLRESRNVKF